MQHDPGGRWPRTAVVICAGGSGRRMGGLDPKQFEPLCEQGPSALALAVHALAELPLDTIAVAHPPGQGARVRELLGPVPGTSRRVLVTGGETRQQSVLQALEALPRSTELVFVHDAARPFASPELYRTLMGRLLAEPGLGGVVPCLALVDTVKRVRQSRLVETVAREELAVVQTPQLFPYGLLLELHRRAAAHGQDYTDDAALLEHAGEGSHPVGVVEGAQWNLKLTRPADRVIAAALLKGELVAHWSRL